VSQEDAKAGAGVEVDPGRQASEEIGPAPAMIGTVVKTDSLGRVSALRGLADTGVHIRSKFKLTLLLSKCKLRRDDAGFVECW